MFFSSTGSKMPAVHRTNDFLPSITNTPSSASHNQNLSVAAVHRHVDTCSVALCKTVDLKPDHEGLAIVYIIFIIYRQRTAPLLSKAASSPKMIFQTTQNSSLSKILLLPVPLLFGILLYVLL